VETARSTRSHKPSLVPTCRSASCPAEPRT
jgi:hypothetical protein